MKKQILPQNINLLIQISLSETRSYKMCLHFLLKYKKNYSWDPDNNSIIKCLI